MARASGVELRLETGAIPVLPGALELHRAGVAVSKCGANRAALEGSLEVEGAPDEALVDLLFDPQTSGGLLLALARDEAADLVAELRAGSSPDAAVIGEVAPSHRPILKIRV